MRCSSERRARQGARERWSIVPTGDPKAYVHVGEVSPTRELSAREPAIEPTVLSGWSHGKRCGRVPAPRRVWRWPAHPPGDVWTTPTEPWIARYPRANAARARGWLRPIHSTAHP